MSSWWSMRNVMKSSKTFSTYEKEREKRGRGGEDGWGRGLQSSAARQNYFVKYKQFVLIYYLITFSFVQLGTYQCWTFLISIF
jgi:hypothetical protein